MGKQQLIKSLIANTCLHSDRFLVLFSGTDTLIWPVISKSCKNSPSELKLSSESWCLIRLTNARIYFNCDECEAKYVWEIRSKWHMKCIHEESKSLFCPWMISEFIHSESLVTKRTLCIKNEGISTSWAFFKDVPKST